VFSLLTDVRCGPGGHRGRRLPCREAVLRGRDPACLSGPRGRRDERPRET